MKRTRIFSIPFTLLYTCLYLRVGTGYLPSLGMKWSATRSTILAATSIDDHALQRYLKNAQKKEMKNFKDNLSPKWLQNQSSMPFDCTACGKCCKTVGSVYLSPEEVDRAANLLEIKKYDFINKYCSHTLRVPRDPSNIWGKLKDKTFDDGQGNISPACIFLDTETNYCKIYEARPTQCSTYPFWPSLLSSSDTWNAECRRIDGADSDLPEWSADLGGCEGMRPIQTAEAEQRDEGEIVQMKKAYQQLYEYTQQLNAFPAEADEEPTIS